MRKRLDCGGKKNPCEQDQHQQIRCLFSHQRRHRTAGCAERAKVIRQSCGNHIWDDQRNPCQKREPYSLLANEKGGRRYKHTRFSRSRRTESGFAAQNEVQMLEMFLTWSLGEGLCQDAGEGEIIAGASS